MLNLCKHLPGLAIAGLAATLLLAPSSLPAQTPAPSASPMTAATPGPAPSPGASPSMEDRVANLEAYLSNSAQPKSIQAAPGPGHNAWMMTSSALVLFMTLPGLALFYGGLVRRKNVLSVLAQCLGIAGLVTVLWWAFGYSLVFGKSFNNPFYGGSEFFFLKGVDSSPNTDYAYWVSQNVYAMYQLMFAIITPALIVGAIAERMKYSTLMVFMGCWMFLVYFPMAHMVWGVSGFMDGISNSGAGIKAIDFAGGTVVHMTSGWSALILCLILGPRLGFKREPIPPHNLVLTMIGTGMLWVGWYGFNAGSAVAADTIAANAFTTTTLATAVAAFTWAVLEKVLRGKASVLGYCTGAVAGLVVITPACGFVNATGAMIIGVLAAVVPYIAVAVVKPALGYDDALDTFGVHAVGGTIGAILTGILATKEVNPNVDKVANGLLVAQLSAVAVTLVLSTVATAIIAIILKVTMGLRPSAEVETSGLDIAEHGEEAYIS
ncbi:MAG: ammonium transporter [Verrucomicrobia bacterium]|nr:ammonium transporter [Verrucomicrobiota bacterium]